MGHILLDGIQVGRRPRNVIGNYQNIRNHLKPGGWISLTRDCVDSMKRERQDEESWKSPIFKGRLEEMSVVQGPEVQG